MACNSYNLTSNCDCPDSGCSPCAGIGCPIFNIKKNDNKPFFKIKVEDCNGYPIDLKNQIVEASMWFNSRLLKSITKDQNFIQLADQIGFNQLLPGNIIQLSTGRNFERMTVTGFDEVLRLVYVDRGTNQTLASAWPKGTALRCFKFLNNPAIGEMIFSDTLPSSGEPGMVAYDLGRGANITPVYGVPVIGVGPFLIQSYLVYEWKPADTCLAGCFYFEFKILTPVTTTTTPPPDYGAGFYCVDMGLGYTCLYCPSREYIIQNGWTYIQGPEKSCEALNFCRQYPNPRTSGLNWLLELSPDSLPFVGDSELGYDPFIAGIPNGQAPFAGEWVFSDASLGVQPNTASNIVAQQCSLPFGVEFLRKYPLTGEGFVIQIWNSPTSESVLVYQ